MPEQHVIGTSIDHDGMHHDLIHVNPLRDARYFGLRTYELADGPKGKRPLLNGKFAFAAGFLDQSFWPDGQYTAPTDDALAYDIEVLDTFGLNMIR